MPDETNTTTNKRAKPSNTLTAEHVLGTSNVTSQHFLGGQQRSWMVSGPAPSATDNSPLKRPHAVTHPSASNGSILLRWAASISPEDAASGPTQQRNSGRQPLQTGPPAAGSASDPHKRPRFETSEHARFPDLHNTAAWQTSSLLSLSPPYRFLSAPEHVSAFASHENAPLSPPLSSLSTLPSSSSSINTTPSVRDLPQATEPLSASLQGAVQNGLQSHSFISHSSPPAARAAVRNQSSIENIAIEGLRSQARRRSVTEKRPDSRQRPCMQASNGTQRNMSQPSIQGTVQLPTAPSSRMQSLYLPRLQYYVNSLVTKNQQPGWEKQRAALLIKACNYGDFFFILIHQIYCWLALVPLAATQLGFDMNQVKALEGLQMVLLPNERLSSSAVKWFMYFPADPREVVLNPTALVASALNAIKAFLRQLSVERDAVFSSCLERRYPPSAEELYLRLAMPSTVLQEVFFTFLFRQIEGFEDQAWTEEAVRFFTANQIQLMNSLHYVNALEAEDRLAKFAAEYYALRSQHARVPLLNRNAISSAPTTIPLSSPTDSDLNTSGAAMTSHRPLPTSLLETPLPLTENHPQQPGADGLTHPAVSHTYPPGQMQGVCHSNEATRPQHTFPSPITAQLQPPLSSLQPAWSQIPRASQYGIAQHSSATTQAAPISSQQPSFATIDGGRRNVDLAQTPQNRVQRPQRSSQAPLATTDSRRRHADPAQTPQNQVQRPQNSSQAPSVALEAPRTGPTAPAVPSSSTAVRTGGLRQKSTMLLPPTGKLLALMTNPNPNLMALHQAHLTSPGPLKIDLEGNLNQKIRLYQYFCRFALEPQCLDIDRQYYKWELNVSSAEVARIPRDIRLPSISRAKLYREIKQGTVLYRLRCVKLSNVQPKIPELDWATTATSWPGCSFISLNGSEIELRRKSHHGRDLPCDLSRGIVEGSNAIEFSRHPGPEDRNLNFALAVEMVQVIDHNIAMKMPSFIDHESSLRAITESLLRVPARDDPDLEVVDAHISIDLIDPFSSTIFATPVRGRTCSHRECFDLENFLISRTSRSKDGPTSPDEWRCPICRHDARPQNLVIDGFLVTVRQTLEAENILRDCTVRAICVEADGSWKPAGVERKVSTPRDDDYTIASLKAKPPQSVSATAESVDRILGMSELDPVIIDLD